MLPLILDEQQAFTFKFWFDNQIQTGMHYQNELFCRIAVFDVQQRPQVYKTACKLAQQGIGLAVSCSQTSCCLWGNLRDEMVKKLLTSPPELQPDLLAQACVNVSS